MQQTSKQYMTMVRLIHFALLSGQVIFLCVVLFLKTTNAFPSSPDSNDIFQIIVPVVALGGFLAARFLYNMKIKQGRVKPLLKDKLAEYRTASLIRAALLEGPALFGIIAYMLTGSPVYLGVVAVLLLTFLMNTPTISQISLDMELTSDEKEKLEDPEAVVAESTVGR